MATVERLDLLGSPGSPYTRKMLALLRYRHIPYRMLWGGHHMPPQGYPAPKVRLLPTVYFRGADGELEAAVDSTPIIRRLEAEVDGRSVIPADPELAFYNELIEDYADEWLTKAMFHYRWHHEADRRNAGPMLTYWSDNTLPEAEARDRADQFTKRQFDRLYVVGSSPLTATTIEQSYHRLVSILDKLIQLKGYVLGSRPSSADFAIYGQLTQLGIVEPTPAAVMSDRSPRLRAWLDRIEDLSGLDPEDSGWFSIEEARTALAPLLAEIGRVYVPFLAANAQAVAAGAKSLETEIDGRTWSQPVFPYQAKCLAALRDAVAKLPEASAHGTIATLRAAGCDGLITDAAAAPPKP